MLFPLFLLSLWAFLSLSTLKQGKDSQPLDPPFSSQLPPSPRTAQQSIATVAISHNLNLSFKSLLGSSSLLDLTGHLYLDARLSFNLCKIGLNSPLLTTKPALSPGTPSTQDTNRGRHPRLSDPATSRPAASPNLTFCLSSC